VLASTANPTVRIAAADVDVAKAELRGSKSGFYPEFNFELGGFAGHDVDGVEGSDVQGRAFLRMRYNLFRGGGDIAREREAFARLNETRQTLANERRLAEEDARISYIALETARRRVETLRAAVVAQRRTRDVYAQEFDIGARSLLDLLDAENELFVERSNLLTAEYTEEFAVYRVLAVTGQLLDELNIARPAESISIWRTGDDAQTPERIRSKSIRLDEPGAEPRILREPEAGAPPAVPPRVPAGETTTSMTEPGSLFARAPGASKAAPEPEVAASPAPPAGTAEPEASFTETFETVFTRPDRPAEPTATMETPVTVTAEPVESPEQVAAAPQPSTTKGSDVEYDSFSSFFSSVFGEDEEPEVAAEPPAAAPSGETGAIRVTRLPDPTASADAEKAE
jgi:adhesin transport system outer membrane protein